MKLQKPFTYKSVLATIIILLDSFLITCRLSHFLTKNIVTTVCILSQPARKITKCPESVLHVLQSLMKFYDSEANKNSANWFYNTFSLFSAFLFHSKIICSFSADGKYHDYFLKFLIFTLYPVLNYYEEKKTNTLI